MIIVLLKSTDCSISRIKNGKYLAVPIDEDGYNNAKWVTVKANEQNVAHMPAYQWLF